MPDGRALFLRDALPGEIFRADSSGARGEGFSGRILECVEASPDRVVPPCPHFPTCGGCALQHWADAPYRAWKLAQLDTALRRAGYAPSSIGLTTTPPRGRRRADFAVRRQQGGVVEVGFHVARSTDIVDIAGCQVLDPALTALVAPLRAVLRRVSALRREGAAVVNLLDTGPDLLLRGEAALTTVDRTTLIGFAREQGIGRIAWIAGRSAVETVCLLRPPSIRLCGVAVTPPPGAFLQASREGEAAITAAVLAGVPAALKPRSRIADLYAGCGTLTFPLATRARVSAYEGGAPSAAALLAGANAAGLAGRVEVARRDMTVQPLLAAELADFAVAVLDPPFAGAPIQIAELARSKCPRLIYVSCNPAALARDAAVLHGAGWRLVAAEAIDQFLWSARLESVCVFDGPGRAATGPRRRR